MRNVQRVQSIQFSRKFHFIEKKNGEVDAVATRPLAMKCNVQNLNLLYTHDANKNVTEVFFKNPDNGLAAHYEYSPFGELRDFSYLSTTPETSNSEVNSIVETSNSGSQLMGNEILSHALNSGTNAIAETLNSANALPGDLIGWRDTPITEIDIRTFNPFRFSSEYHDDELNLIYYNYRHYNPATGRFLSRDPIEEQGGTNLYNFLENDPLNFVDLLGLKKCEFIYYVGIHGGDAEEMLNKFYDGRTSRSCLEGAWSTGCNMFANDLEKRKIYNKNLRPSGASKLDKSNTGRVSKINGNRGFNKSIITKREKKLPNGGFIKANVIFRDLVDLEDKKQAGSQGYVNMINNDWLALKAEAKTASENCLCECFDITLKFIIHDNGGFELRTRGTGFIRPQDTTYECKKNKKE